MTSAEKDYAGLTQTLYTLARIYDIGAQLLHVPEKTPVQRVVEYGQRIWADRYVMALGWGLLAAIAFAVLLIAWPR